MALRDLISAELQELEFAKFYDLDGIPKHYKYPHLTESCVMWACSDWWRREQPKQISDLKIIDLYNKTHPHCDQVDKSDTMLVAASKIASAHIRFEVLMCRII